MLRNILRLKEFTHAAKSLVNGTARVQCKTFAASGKTLKNSDFKENTEESTKNVTKNKNNPFAAAGPITSEWENSGDVEQLSEEEREKRLKVLQLEVDIAHQEGRRVPSLDFLQDHHWEEVLKLPTKSSRNKFYAYLWHVEMKRDSKERKKQERAVSFVERKERERMESAENNHIIYALSHTSLFLRIYDSTINFWQNNRLTRAMQFEPKIVLDCSYDQYMTRREANYAAKQLMLCFAENRAHDQPFDMHYCNVNMKSPCIQGLHRYIPTMLNPEFPMNVHKNCFTEIFDRDNLVYLTPHCRNDLQEYNPDDVYIIGAMVDTVNNEPLSLAKAKKLGLRMARLPLDRYLQWGSGSGKSLTLNQMVNILLDLRMTRDWTKALSHVPRRKIINMEADAIRQRHAMNKRSERLNVSLEKILEREDGSVERTPKKVRSFKDGMQFNLETWGSRKKKANSQ